MENVSISRIKMPLAGLLGIAELKGINFSPSTPRSINKFESLPPEIQNGIYDGLNEWLEIVEEINPTLPPQNYEVQLLEEAANKLGLTVPDDFKRTIQPEDIVEVYDLKCERQIYRNMQFLKYSSYDLLMITTHQWDELFERANKYNDLVKERSTSVALKAEKIEPWNIEEHYLKEKLDPKQRVFKMKMGYLSPVYDKETGERRAWASTLQVELVGSAIEDSQNVSPLY